MKQKQLREMLYLLGYNPRMIRHLWKAPAALILLLPVVQHAHTDQSKITTATVVDIQQAGGFAKVCGRDDTAISEANAAVLKSNKTGDFTALLFRAQDAALVDREICITYLSGLIDGWQEGHQHGVDVMLFPAGIPNTDHYGAALKSLPIEQLKIGAAASKADPMCVPEHITQGEVLTVVVRYIKADIAKNTWTSMIPTARMVHPALKGTYRCPVDQDKQP